MTNARDHLSFWTSPTRPSWGDTTRTLKALSVRWDRYEAGDVDQYITPVDDMLGADSQEMRDGYLAVGRSALDIITEAMLLSGRTEFNRILDMPCGGGRVTRHIVKFFPDAKIFVDDIVAEKRNAVRDQFHLEVASCARDFKGAMAIPFDMIFVGSLFTHLEERIFEDALNYLLASLSAGGLLILTTHGRFAATVAATDQRKLGRSRRPISFLEIIRMRRERVPVDDVLEAIEGNYIETGFGYTEFPSFAQAYGQSYGASFTTPSRLMRLIEARTDAAILGFKERGFAHHQDVLTVQKLTS
ncbi:MAG: hypothetical protein NVSMB26_19850 [Beijerinckiaceae bacterium]